MNYTFGRRRFGGFGRLNENLRVSFLVCGQQFEISREFVVTNNGKCTRRGRFGAIIVFIVCSLAYSFVSRSSGWLRETKLRGLWRRDFLRSKVSTRINGGRDEWVEKISFNGICRGISDLRRNGRLNGVFIWKPEKCSIYECFEAGMGKCDLFAM